MAERPVEPRSLRLNVERVAKLVETVKDGMTLKFVDPPDAKTQEALAALLELSHLADLRQKERAGWEIRTLTAETRVNDLEGRIARCYRGESFDLLWEALDKPLASYPAGEK